MKRSTKIAIKYMTFVWLFTTCLAFLVNCKGVDGVQGSPGKDGTNPAPNPLDVVELIDPCGEQADYDEIILRLRDGSLIANYRDGGKNFFALIKPGRYQTTDGTHCIFTVDASGVVRW